MIPLGELQWCHKSYILKQIHVTEDDINICTSNWEISKLSTSRFLNKLDISHNMQSNDQNVKFRETHSGELVNYLCIVMYFRQYAIFCFSFHCLGNDWSKIPTVTSFMNSFYENIWIRYIIFTVNLGHLFLMSIFSNISYCNQYVKQYLIIQE